MLFQTQRVKKRIFFLPPWIFITIIFSVILGIVYLFNLNVYFRVAFLVLALLFIYINWLSYRERVYVSDDKVVHSKHSKFLLPWKQKINLKDVKEVKFLVGNYIEGEIFSAEDKQKVKEKILRKLSTLTKMSNIEFYLNIKTKKILVRLFFDKLVLISNDKKVLCSFVKSSDRSDFLKILGKKGWSFELDGFVLNEVRP